MALWKVLALVSGFLVVESACVVLSIGGCIATLLWSGLHWTVSQHGWCYPSRLTPTQWRVTHSSSLAKEKSFPENISLQLFIRNAVVDFSDKWLISQMDFPTYLELFQKPICEKD